MLQRVVEQACRLIPGERRFAAERRARGYFEHRRLERAEYAFVSFGKSGRTWLRVMISRVYQRKHGLAEGALLEFDNFHRRAREIPRILFTHDNYLRDYTRDGGGKAAFRDKRVILLVRHPADVAVSVYHHWKHRMRPHKALLNGYPPTSEDVSLYEFLMRPCGLDKVIGFMNEWAQEIDSLEHCLVVRYEDLREDTARELARVMSFLGVDGKPQEIEEAVEYAAFENMRKRESRSESSSDRLRATDLDNPNSFKTRRGQAGGYRNDFPPSELQSIERKVATALHGRFGYGERDVAYEN